MTANRPDAAAVDTYDRRTIVLHWLTAALVPSLWTVGQAIDFFPGGTPRVTARSLRICTDVVLGLLLAVRIGWRVRGGVKLPTTPGLSGRLAIGLHHGLYLALAVVVLAGVACVWIRGDSRFNLFTVPAFDPGNKALRETAVDLHGLLANVLLAGAGLHAAAALWHHRVLKDGVLRRMWPARR